MINKILWFILLYIYIYCIYNSPKESFNNTIKNDIIYGLKVIDELFNKHNIYYTIAYGTLLGAIRHWDMIPWDDDGDINVWNKDYNKILGLKAEFKERGLMMEADWKLIKIYFNDKKYPFIDIFLNDIEDGKIVRCINKNNKCTMLSKENKWWWKWINYPSNWIIKRKRVKFNTIELWAPIESNKLLKYWYGEKCLEECKTPELDHTTGNNVEPENITCGILPEPQI